MRQLFSERFFDIKFIYMYIYIYVFIFSHTHAPWKNMYESSSYRIIKYDKICERDIVILLRTRGAAAKNSFCIIHITYVRGAKAR